jgi:hypothetical protein
MKGREEIGWSTENEIEEGTVLMTCSFLRE